MIPSLLNFRGIAHWWVTRLQPCSFRNGGSDRITFLSDRITNLEPSQIVPRVAYVQLSMVNVQHNLRRRGVVYSLCALNIIKG